MDSIYSSRTNERIMQGNFPQEVLQKGAPDTPLILNSSEKGKDYILYFKRNPTKLYEILLSTLKRCNTAEPPWSMQNPINVLINTRYDPRALWDCETLSYDTPICQEAAQLCPVVTELDKAFWLLINECSFFIKTVNDEDKEYPVGLFFAYLHLFKIIQANEMQFGKTLDLSSIENPTQTFDLIFAEWNNSHTHEHFVNLNSKETYALEELNCARNTITRKLQEEISNAATVASQTEMEWDKFLEVLNLYSQKEADAVARVCSKSLSKQEKLEAIDKYISIIYNNSDGYCDVNNNTIQLAPILEAIEKRMQQAPFHCIVIDQAGQSFKLHPYSCNLLIAPITFNLLFLLYHQFRLSPQKDNALTFCNAALHSSKCNLSVPDGEVSDSLDVLVEKFCHEFLSFTAANQSYIANLSFDNVQQDTVFIGSASLTATAVSTYWKYIYETLESAIVMSQQEEFTHTSQMLQNTFSKDQLQGKARKIKSETVARQAIVSLHIAYLFCDALRIMQRNYDEHKYFEDDAAVDRYKSDLEWEVDKLSFNVYTKKANLRKYRLDKGIETKSLSEQESAEEQIKNDAFVYNILDTLDTLASRIDDLDIEGLISLSKEVKPQIRKHAACNLKADLTERFVSISERICNRLVTLCKTTTADFDCAKQHILSHLGAEAMHLPQSAIDSLATAELLYKKYASAGYAEKGFDYSCISSLYYQAFEDGYNKLIWREYANWLNNEVKIDGHNFTEILFDHKDDDDLGNPKAKGYLGRTAKSRRYYVDYYNDEHIASVKTNLMYASFASLMSQVEKGAKQYSKFCGYFARTVGFPNCYVMFEDTHFMEMVSAFAKAVETAANDRNNASHGGSPVSFTQCKKDKLTVLHELESVRECSIGLIQQLLYITRNSPSHAHN